MSNQVKFDANQKNYRIADQLKRYSLKDFGFEETSPGKFRFERHLGERASLDSPQLKVTISNDFSKLKISTTTADGLKRMDISQGDGLDHVRQNADSYLKQMVEEGILEEV